MAQIHGDVFNSNFFSGLNLQSEAFALKTINGWFVQLGFQDLLRSQFYPFRRNGHLFFADKDEYPRSCNQLIFLSDIYLQGSIFFRLKGYVSTAAPAFQNFEISDSLGFFLNSLAAGHVENKSQIIALFFFKFI